MEAMIHIDPELHTESSAVPAQDGAAKQAEARPSAVVLPLLLTLLIGLGLTALLFRSFVEADNDRLREAVAHGAQTMADAATQLDTYYNPVLMAVSDMLTSIQADIGRGETVSETLLQEHLWQSPPLGLEATSLEYLPRITREDLAIPARLRNRLGDIENAGFPILERSGDSLRAASLKDEYYPVLLNIPFDSAAVGFESPAPVIGLDLSSDPMLRQTLLQARDSGLLSSFSYFPTEASGDMMLTRYYLPLYDTPEPPATVAERRAHHIGFISAISYFDSALTLPFLPESYHGLEAIYFPSASENVFPDDTSDAFRQALDSRDIVHHGYLVDGLPFNVATRASDALRREMVSNNRWWVLLLGLSLTAWMTTIVLWSAYQSRKIIKVVEARTRDLAEQTRRLSEVNVALRQSEARYRMLADNISDVIYTHDLDGICTYISPSIRQQNGFGVEDYLGKPIYCHMVESSAEKTRSDMAETVAQCRRSNSFTPVEGSYEFETYCKDGSRKPMEAVISALTDEHGRISGFLGVMRDISARKKAEHEKEQLQNAYRQAQKMEAIGTLAGGIAHDFNNLLTGVIGHADLLKLQFGDYPEALESLDTIEMAALRAKDLTSQLLGFARKGQYQAVPVEINRVMSEVVSLIGRTMNKNIDISKTDCSDNPVVTGDPAQITQIFLNLAVNARDAMPDGGKLSFDISLQQLDEDFCHNHIDLEPGQYCVISVSDTGTGIARDKIEHIFEPFFTDKTDGRGTGLGLAMVYGVTRSHKGSVTVYSEENRGTIFKVYLPATAGVESAQALPKPASLARGAGNILLVDDQEVVRHIGEKLLHRLGYEVELAEDGRKAVEYYRGHWHDIDLVILDIVMPQMGGLECLETLRRINPGIKAILASGFSKDSIAEKVNEDHIMGFLQKPFRIQELSELVASIHH